MDRDLTHRICCAVCGIETKRHSGWFLVMDNIWLDRVQVLSWHPLLAREARTHGVCSKEHLKVLLTHWLNHANLQLLSSGACPWPEAMESDPSGPRDSVFSVGMILGELAVERESLSSVWTGSQEAMECILDALVGGTESQFRRRDLATLVGPVGYSREYAFPH